MFDVLSFLHTC